jgi:hypothetical protein
LPTEDLKWSMQTFYCHIPAPTGKWTIQVINMKLDSLSNKKPWELTSYWPRNCKYSLSSYNLSPRLASLLLWARRIPMFAPMRHPYGLKSTFLEEVILCVAKEEIQPVFMTAWVMVYRRRKIAQ